jgi:CRP-like cAMP-binding protein
MCASALFAGLTRSECQQIASWGRLRTFIRDEVIFIQGQPIQSLILFLAGCAKLTQLSPGGYEVILWVKGERETIGIHGDPSGGTCVHNCSARAMEQCTALLWDYPLVQRLFGEFPKIRANISQILSDHLTELQERFREIATERVANRLALALLRLTKQVGRPHVAGTQVSLSRAELAQLIGTNLFTTSRILSKWNETGVVLTRREAVVVRDLKRLQTHAEALDYSEGILRAASRPRSPDVLSSQISL